VPSSGGEAAASLVALYLLTLPLGACLIRVGERCLKRRVALSLVERLVLAPYAAGGLLFVLASIPLPIFTTTSVVLVLSAGGVAYSALAFQERASGLRSALRAMVRPSYLLMGVGAIGLLYLELGPVWNLSLPNAWDGSMTALWTTLTLSQHTLPWTLNPFESAGVSYPLGPTVWMALPVMLAGWPVVSAPLLLPPLFLSFSIPAAYCWGSRLCGPSGTHAELVGVIFAAFFGLVASWPRLYVGGSYDFALALPLLILCFGWLPGLVHRGLGSGRELLLLGLVAGTLTSLSLVAGEAFVLLFAGFGLAVHARRRGALARWLCYAAVLAAVEAAFVVRSIAATVVWYRWPAHVLTQTGNLPSPPSAASPFPLLPFAQGYLDPFVPWKPKLSPFPALSLELQILLVAGIGILAIFFFKRDHPWSRSLPRDFALSVGGGTLVSFVVTILIGLASIPGSPLLPIAVFSSLLEWGVLLFLFLSAIALAPLLVAGIVAVEALHGRRNLPNANIGSHSPSNKAAVAWSLSRIQPRAPSTVAVGLMLLSIPLAAGLTVTVLDGPSYIHSDVTKTANVTAADLAGLRWVGSELPTCSGVLVAPGSVGQFLPEFASVKLIYQMIPQPWNLSYYISIQNLTSGIYTSVTQDALLYLGVTEVLVSGQTSISYPPFDPSPLESSSDFSTLFSAGDLMVLEFIPGVLQSGCTP
jgi:hypothetical protein